MYAKYVAGVHCHSFALFGCFRGLHKAGDAILCRHTHLLAVIFLYSEALKERRDFLSELIESDAEARTHGEHLCAEEIHALARPMYGSYPGLERWVERCPSRLSRKTLAELCELLQLGRAHSEAVLKYRSEIPQIRSLQLESFVSTFTAQNIEVSKQTLWKPGGFERICVPSEAFGAIVAMSETTEPVDMHALACLYEQVHEATEVLSQSESEVWIEAEYKARALMIP